MIYYYWGGVLLWTWGVLDFWGGTDIILRGGDGENSPFVCKREERREGEGEGGDRRRHGQPVEGYIRLERPS